MSRWPDRDVQQRPVPIRDIRRHTHRRAQPLGGLLYRGRRTAHRCWTDIEVAPYEWYLMDHRMRDSDFRVLPIVPLLHVRALQTLPSLDGIGCCSEQRFVIVSEPTWRP